MTGDIESDTTASFGDQNPAAPGAYPHHNAPPGGYPAPVNYAPGAYAPGGQPFPGYTSTQPHPGVYPPGTSSLSGSGSPPPYTGVFVVNDAVDVDESQDCDCSKSNLGPMLPIFIVGWIFFPVWFGGFCSIKSKKPARRGLAIASVVLACVCAAVIVIVVGVVVSEVVAAEKAIFNGGTTSCSPYGYGCIQYYTLSGSSTGLAINNPSDYEYASISATGTWSGGQQTYYSAVSADGSSTYCESYDCPKQYAPYMELVAQCMDYYSYVEIGSYTSSLECSGGFYLRSNDDYPSDNSGSLSITVTWA